MGFRHDPPCGGSGRPRGRPFVAACVGPAASDRAVPCAARDLEQNVRASAPAETPEAPVCRWAGPVWVPVDRPSRVARRRSGHDHRVRGAEPARYPGRAGRERGLPSEPSTQAPAPHRGDRAREVPRKGGSVSVQKAIDLSGSGETIQDAVSEALDRARETLEGITKFEVKDITGRSRAPARCTRSRSGSGSPCWSACTDERRGRTGVDARQVDPRRPGAGGDQGGAADRGQLDRERQHVHPRRR